MNAIKVSPSDAMVRRILQATYPSYRGRKVTIVPQRYPLNVRSCWGGGSRDYFVFLRLDTFAVAPMPAQSAFDKPVQGADAVTLPVGIVCVEHSIFCGKDAGIRIHVNPDNLVAMLPENAGRTL
jgi:hypothetical protein